MIAQAPRNIRIKMTLVLVAFRPFGLIGANAHLRKLWSRRAVSLWDACAAATSRACGPDVAHVRIAESLHPTESLQLLDEGVEISAAAGQAEEQVAPFARRM